MTYTSTDGSCRSDLDPRSSDWARQEALRQRSELEQARKRNKVLNRLLLEAVTWGMSRNEIMAGAAEDIREGNVTGIGGRRPEN